MTMKSFRIFAFLLLVQITLSKADKCLSSQQESQLETTVEAVQSILVVTASTLRKFGENENDKQVKEKLEEAAKICSIVSQNIFGNLTKIVNEACGPCENVIKAIKDGFVTIEATLTEVEPSWKDELMFKEVMIALDAVLSAAAEICAGAEKVSMNALEDEGCLTAKQDKDLKLAVKVMETILGSTVAALDVAIAAEDNQKIKNNLIEARTVIVAICKDLIDKLVTIGEGACSSCDAVVHTISESAKALETTIVDIKPVWADSVIFQNIVTGIDAALKIAGNSCPEMKELVSPIENNCLTPDQDEELKIIVKRLDKLFEIVTVSLNVAAAAAKDVDTREKLREAARIIHAVDESVLKGKLVNLTEEGSCGSCEDIVNTIKDGIHTVEKTLETAMPEWADLEIYKAVVEALDEVITLANQFCQKEESLLAHKDCLSPEQDEKLKVVVNRLDKLFSLAEVALDIASRAVDDEKLKEEFRTAENVVRAIDSDIIKTKLVNLTEEGSCGSCEEIVATVKDAISALEDTISKIQPDWQENPIFVAVDRSIKFLMPFIERVCEKEKLSVPVAQLRGNERVEITAF